MLGVFNRTERRFIFVQFACGGGTRWAESDEVGRWGRRVRDEVLAMHKRGVICSDTAVNITVTIS